MNPEDRRKSERLVIPGTSNGENTSGTLGTRSFSPAPSFGSRYSIAPPTSRCSNGLTPARPPKWFVRIVAVAGPGLEVEMVVGQSWEHEPRFGRPVPLDAAGRPQFECSLVGEKVAIAKADTVGESAASRQRAELRVNTFAIEEEDRLVLGEVHGALETARLVRLHFLGLLLTALPVDL